MPAARPPAARRTDPGRARPGRAGRRSAFTLLELLVVVAIIGTLLAISVGATFAFLTTARESATRATLAKVDGKLQRRLSAFYIDTQAGGSLGGVSDVLSVMGIKNKQLGTMPQYMATDGEDFTLERNDVAVRLNNANGDPAPPFGRDGFNVDPTASSEALLLFLERAETFGERDTDGQAFRESELADTDGDGFRELVDGFGNPLRFYRWPTRLVRPALDTNEDGAIDPTEVVGVGNQDDDGRFPLVTDRDPDAGSAGVLGAIAAVMYEASLPTPAITSDGVLEQDGDPDDPFLPTTGSLLRADTQDPFGLVQGELIREIVSGRQAGAAFFRPAAGDSRAMGQRFERMYHTPATFYKPIVISAGPDGELGLFEPQDREAFGHLAQPGSRQNDDGNAAVPLEAAFDNLTNLQRGFQ